MSTKPAIAANLPPVVTRQDCYSWLSEEDLQAEVWVALRGAIRYMQEEDFSDPGDGVSLQPGTVLDASDGQPRVDRAYFFGQLIEFVYWRLHRYAEAQGLRMNGFTDVSVRPYAFGELRDRLDAHPYGKYVSGDVQTFHFDTEREMRAFMRANGLARKKNAPTAGCNSTGAVINFDGGKADGTDCRT